MAKCGVVGSDLLVKEKEDEDVHRGRRMEGV